MVLHRSAGPGLAAAVVLSIVLTACGSSNLQPAPSQPLSPPSGGTVAAPTPATSVGSALPSATPSPSALPTAALITSGWLAGFKIAVDQASLDSSTGSLTLDVLVTNTAQRDSGLNAVSSHILLDPGDGSGLAVVRGLQPSTDIVAGSTAHGSLTFDVASGFSLNAAQLVLGKPGTHQWLVPLESGRPASGPKPVRLRPPPTMRTAGGIYYHITSAQVLPWSCTGITPFTAYIPSDKSVSVLAVKGTAGAGRLRSYAGTIETVAVTAPDGTTSNSTTPPLKDWASNQSTPDVLQCLPVPADAHGVFTIRISDQQHSTATATITVP